MAGVLRRYASVLPLALSGLLAACAAPAAAPVVTPQPLATASSSASVAAEPVPPPNPAVRLAASERNTCVVTAARTVRCWGDNEFGQLGDGSTTDSVRPVEARVADAVAVTLGPSHACALTGTGRVLCWGDLDYGTSTTGPVHRTSTPQEVAGLSTPLAALVSGLIHDCGLTADGGVLCWGNAELGQLGDDTTAPRLTPGTVPGLVGVTALAAGGHHTCALTGEGVVWCWGENTTGQLGTGTTSRFVAVPTRVDLPERAMAIAAGGNHTCAALVTATYCWGADNQGQLGDGRTGVDWPTPVQVQGLTSVSLLALGGSHSCALAGDAVVSCWGSNVTGQLGTGGSGAPTPAPVLKLADVAAGPVVALAAGWFHTCALAGDQVFCWGANDRGQLGTGTTSDSLTPLPVA